MHTLAVFLNLDENDDRDMWFADSLTELIDDTIQKFGKGGVGGYGRGGGLEIWATVSETYSPEAVRALEEMLRQYCAPDTRIYEVFNENEDDDKNGEERPLFAPGETAPQNPLPLAAPKFEYRPFELSELPVEQVLERQDRHVFEAIASIGQPDFQSLLFWVDEYSGCTEFELKQSLERLRHAGYIDSREDYYFVTESMLSHLPTTATGTVSTLREQAWDRFFEVFF